MIDVVYENTMELAGVFLVIVAVSLVAWARSLPRSARTYAYVATVPAVTMAVAYLAMAALGDAANLLRFGAYTIMWVPFVLLLGMIAGVTRTLLLALLAIVLGRVWVTLVAWLLDGILGTIAQLAPFVLFAAGIYVLYGPYTRLAATQSEERSLVFDKLKHLVVLAWIGLVVNGIIAADSLALVDDFVGLIAIVYVETLLVVGFGVILLRSAGALEDVAADDSTTIPTSPLERADGYDTDVAD